MKKLTLIILIALSTFSLNLMAQDENPGLEISGSVDAYFKYDFTGESQIPTSFATAQNSFGIGMVDLILAHSVGKASFVGEVAFGPRAEASAPGPIQQLYVSYALTESISVTGGFMGTFVGYEIISPTGNFNYSTSYLFSNGPFQNGGVKVDVAVSDKFAFMVGLFNEFDSYVNTSGALDIGGQIYLAPVSGLDVYVNFVTSNDSGTEIDLTTTYQLTEDFLLGINAANRTQGELFDKTSGAGTNFTGSAVYANYSLNDWLAIGLRGEYFTDEKGSIFGVTDTDTSVSAVTLSANVGSGPLKLIPELRLDSASEQIFTDGQGTPSDMAGQFLLAAYYAF